MSDAVLVEMKKTNLNKRCTMVNRANNLMSSLVDCSKSAAPADRRELEQLIKDFKGIQNRCQKLYDLLLSF